MDFLKTSEFLSKLQSLHTYQLLFFSIENVDSYDVECIFPPQDGHDNGMSIFITLYYVILNIKRTQNLSIVLLI